MNDELKFNNQTTMNEELRINNELKFNNQITMNQSSSNLCISLFHLTAIVKSVIDLISTREQKMSTVCDQNNNKDNDDDNE